MKKAIISPSGNFYGSEQVLFDYLRNTNHKYDVFVPTDSIFKQKLEALNKHRIFGFKSLIVLYLKIFVLLTTRYEALYLNEGGHVRYVNIISLLLPCRRFIIHFRILEDVSENRLKIFRKNITYIAVSRFLKSHIRINRDSVHCLHDTFDPNLITREKRTYTDINKIGIVGRITPKKGLKEIVSFIEYIEHEKKKIDFHFFGHIELDKPEVLNFINKTKVNEYVKCFFHGFVNSTSEIYNNIDLTLHLNRNEPLGRICFESWSFGVPLVGFNQGGIGELSQELGVSNFTVGFNDDWEKEILEKILQVKENVSDNLIQNVRNKIDQNFNIHYYTKEIDNFINLK